MLEKENSEEIIVSTPTNTTSVSIIPQARLSDEDITEHFNSPFLEAADEVPEAFRMAESEEEVEEQKHASSENTRMDLELEKSDCQQLEVKRVCLDGDPAGEPELLMHAQTPRSNEFHFQAGDRMIESESEEKESSDEDYDPSQVSFQIFPALFVSKFFCSGISDKKMFDLVTALGTIFTSFLCNANYREKEFSTSWLNL